MLGFVNIQTYNLYMTDRVKYHKEFNDVKGLIWRGNIQIQDGLFETMFPTDSPEGNQKQKQNVPGLYVRLAGPKMFTPFVSDMIETVLKNVDYVLMFCRNQDLSNSTGEDQNRFSFISQTQERLINLLDRGFVDTNLPELEIAEDLNRGQILSYFRNAYPELANFKRFNIYKSKKFSNFIITVLTDEIAEYNHTFLTVINRYQGDSKIFQSVGFWRKYLKRTLPQTTKDTELPRVYRTSIRTGRIEIRTCPLAVFRHFGEFFTSAWPKVRKSYTSMPGYNIANLNFYSSNKDLTSLRIVRQLQNLFSPLKIGNVYEAYFTLVKKPEDGGQIKNFDIEKAFIEQIQQKCKTHSVDGECLFYVNIKSKEIYLISLNMAEQADRLKNFKNSLKTELILERNLANLNKNEGTKQKDTSFNFMRGQKGSSIGSNSKKAHSQGNKSFMNHNQGSGLSNSMSEGLINPHLQEGDFKLFSCGHRVFKKEMKAFLAGEIRNMIDQDITEFNHKINCSKVGCEKQLLAPEIKLLVNNEIFEKYMKLCFRKFLFKKYTRYRTCLSSHCLNIIQRYPLSITYGVCELCGNVINFDNLEITENKMDMDNAQSGGLALIDSLDTPIDMEKSDEPVLLQDLNAKKNIPEELSKDEKIKRWLPKPEDLKITAETIEYTVCDEMSIINPKDSVIAGDFNVRFTIFKDQEIYLNLGL